VQNHRALGQMLKVVGADPEIPTIGLLNGPGFHTEIVLMCGEIIVWSLTSKTGANSTR